MKNRNITFTVILPALGFLALSSITQAVVPAPDGGYPGGNTAVGQAALLSLTTGSYNTAVGMFSLLSNTDGRFNTGIGAGALLANTSIENTAAGAGALLSNTTGASNTANGAFALFSNTEGESNTALGDRALFSNTEGNQNTALGAGALASNTAKRNTATGFQALFANTTGVSNTANGAAALLSNTTGNLNTAIGGLALVSNIEGSYNTAIGREALYSNLSSSNTAIGFMALFSNTEGEGNTAVGNGALMNNDGGSNTALGVNAGDGVVTAHNVICIGAGVAGADVNDSCFIGNIREVTPANADAIPVVVDSAGQLGTVASAERFKEQIKPMGEASQSVLALKPVTFRYKSDQTDTLQFGLIAEEVAKVNPDLVVRDRDGQIYSVRYDAVNAMVLNEFLKQHRELGELKDRFQVTVQRQQEEIEALRSQVKEQAAQIRRVSVQVELPQVIATNAKVPKTD